MEHISNVEKAREICGCGNCHHNFKGSECLKYNGILCSLKPCFKNTLQAMGWKKQQLIDKLEDWLANNICNAYNFRGDDISATFMNDCIKAMKGYK